MKSVVVNYYESVKEVLEKLTHKLIIYMTFLEDKTLIIILEDGTFYANRKCQKHEEYTIINMDTSFTICPTCIALSIRRFINPSLYITLAKEHSYYKLEELEQVFKMEQSKRLLCKAMEELKAMNPPESVSKTVFEHAEDLLKQIQEQKIEPKKDCTKSILDFGIFCELDRQRQLKDSQPTSSFGFSSSPPSNESGQSYSQPTNAFGFSSSFGKSGQPYSKPTNAFGFSSNESKQPFKDSQTTNVFAFKPLGELRQPSKDSQNALKPSNESGQQINSLEVSNLFATFDRPGQPLTDSQIVSMFGFSSSESGQPKQFKPFGELGEPKKFKSFGKSGQLSKDSQNALKPPSESGQVVEDSQPALKPPSESGQVVEDSEPKTTKKRNFANLILEIVETSKPPLPTKDLTLPYVKTPESTASNETLVCDEIIFMGTKKRRFEDIFKDGDDINY